MPRLDAVQLRGPDLLRRFIFRSGKRMYGAEMQPSRLIAHSRPSLLGYGVLGLCHARSRAVDQRYTSLAILRSAQLTGCEWCLDFGSKLARDGGVPEADLRDLSRWRDSSRFDARDQVVLRYAEAMTRTPIEVTDELFAELRGHFDESQTVELTMSIAAENLFSRMNWALGLEGQGFSEGTYCVAPDPTAAGALSGA